MAATSPYTPNDYTAVSNFRPFELPINDAFRAISAQNAFWDAGAAKVKSYHDNALNLKLSLEPNKQIRNQYIDDAEKQLTKLSSSDLANAGVQRQGFALYKPLFQDEGIVYDDLTTRHYEKVRNDALTARSKDNGKGYSDINFQYAMQGYNEFLNSQDRMAGKSFYQNRKEYTPYYDYTDDFSKALKDCKPSSIETQSPNYGANNSITGYMKETYSKSLSAGQARGCLEAGLSPNAQRQLQIEGSVMYRNNLPTLASDTATYLSGVSGNLSTQLQQLSAAKAAIMTKKDMSEKEKAESIEAIDLQSKSLSEELDRTNRQVQKIQSGDFIDIQNNFDTYAGSVYSYKKLFKKALSSSFEETRSNYKADPVQMQAIRFSNDKYLNQLDFAQAVSIEDMRNNHDKEMKLLDLMYGGKDASGTMFKGSDIYKNPLTGEITINPNLLRETGNLSDKPEVNEKIYQQLTDQVSSLNQQDNTNNLRLYNNMVSRGERDKAFRETLLKGFNYGLTDDEWNRFKADHANNRFVSGSAQQGLQETPWFKTYTEAQPDDEDVNKWAYDNTVVQSGVQVLNRKLELGEAQVAQELGGDFRQNIQQSISTIKPVEVRGRQVTAQDVQQAIETGREVNGVRIQKSTTGSPIVGSPSGALSGSSYEVFIDGVPSYSTNNGGKVKMMADQITRKVGDVTKKVRDKRIEVYNKLGFDREPWYFTPNEKAPLVETLKSILPKDADGKDLNVKIISSDFSGGIKVAIPGVKKDKDDLLAEILNAGVGTSVEATGDGVVTIKGTNYNLVQQAIQNPVLAEAAYQLNTISATSSFAQTQPGAKVPNTDIKVPVMVRGKQQIMTIETYKNDSAPEFRVYLEGATTSKPFIIASNPYELFEKIGRSPMDFNKPVR